MDRVASLRRDRMVAYSCFFLSGSTGLVYEVVWTRLFGQVIGNTHFSITVVVSVFMAGLAAGSWIGGRIADRSPNPLRLYGILMLLVAAACSFVPALLRAARPLVGWLYRLHDGAPEAPALLAAKIAISAAAVLVPTTFMGATLPALSRHFARRFEQVGAAVGSLYALNTFGAVAGAVFAGFAGVRLLGIYGSIALAIAVDVAIGIAVIAVSRDAGT
ncbi:MAG: fused MFS/spermidine synthase, partial [Planctomycetota bacterium]